MDLRNRIQVNPAIMLGKPVIRGTRITVEAILRKFSDGANMEELLRIYPSLQKEDIFAAFQYASDVIANEEIIVFRAS